MPEPLHINIKSGDIHHRIAITQDDIGIELRLEIFFTGLGNDPDWEPTSRTLNIPWDAVPEFTSCINYVNNQDIVQEE